MDTHSTKDQAQKRPSDRTLNVLSVLVGLATLALGIAWLLYKRYVDLDLPYFAIPLVLTIPVIVAAAFRSFWD
ncbi:MULTISPECIES: hypothetical protein [Cupriavidus]